MIKNILSWFGVLFLAQLALTETMAFLWGLLIVCVIMIFGFCMVKLR